MHQAKSSNIHPQVIPVEQRNLDNYYDQAIQSIVALNFELLKHLIDRIQSKNELNEVMSKVVPALSKHTDYSDEIEGYIKHLESRLATANES